MLFATDDDGSTDVNTILTFVAGIYTQFGMPAGVDLAGVQVCVRGMRQDFPGGLDKASPFKRAANFVCNFVARRPVSTPLPEDQFGPHLTAIDNHANAFIALQLAVESLHEARLEWCDGSIHVLENRIEFSRHSLIDIVDALSTATPSTSFKLVSVLLEQMAYKTNPHCQYPTS